LVGCRGIYATTGIKDLEQKNGLRPEGGKRSLKTSARGKHT